MPASTPEAVRRTIGLNLHDALRTLAGERNMDKGNEFFDLFVERADEVMAAGTVLLDWVPEAVHPGGESERRPLIALSRA